MPLESWDPKHAVWKRQLRGDVAEVVRLLKHASRTPRPVERDNLSWATCRRDRAPQDSTEYDFAGLLSFVGLGFNVLGLIGLRARLNRALRVFQQAASSVGEAADSLRVNR